MTQNYKFIVNGKQVDKNLKEQKVFSSKQFTRVMTEIINDKLKNDYNTKAMQQIIIAIDKINSQCKYLYLVYNLKDSKKGMRTNIKDNFTVNESWKKDIISVIKNKVENSESFIGISDGRPAYTYFQIGLILIDLALHLNIDLDFEINKNEKNILKIEQMPFDNYTHNISKKETLPNEFNLIKCNIELKIGQPNTGKSYSFEENQLFKDVDKKTYEYYKIMVEGGNDSLKSLTSEDITISYNPAKNEAYLSKFIKTVMSAIINNGAPHVIFLDDFHNIDISSLLSPYMGMLKSFQSFTNVDNNVIDTDYDSLDEYTDKWNDYINTIQNANPLLNVFTIENKINGQQVKLFAPKNLYIVGAANWNYNTINMFSDIRERADIHYITLQEKTIDILQSINNKEDYETIIKHINYTLSKVLEEFNIYDFEKYGIGIHRVDKMNEFTEKNVESDLYSVFDLIKDSIQQNGKKSYINEISYLLIKELSKNEILNNIIKVDDLFVVDNYEKLEDDTNNKERFKQVNRKLVELNLYGS
jgi:hypothetical protein